MEYMQFTFMALGLLTVLVASVVYHRARVRLPDGASPAAVRMFSCKHVEAGAGETGLDGLFLSDRTKGVK